MKFQNFLFLIFFFSFFKDIKLAFKFFLEIKIFNKAKSLEEKFS